MTLIALTKPQGHHADLLLGRNGRLLPAVLRLRPDLIAYSATSADIALFSAEDKELVGWFQQHHLSIPFRIMGGPHPTSYPSVLEELNLDAICIGEGDLAFPAVLNVLSAGGQPQNIPNLMTRGQSLKPELQLVQNMESGPMPDHGGYPGNPDRAGLFIHWTLCEK